MKLPNKRKIIYEAFSYAMLLLFTGTLIVYAGWWQAPSGSGIPPGATSSSNAPQPLNVGPVGQAKGGGLILNSAGAVNGLIVRESDPNVTGLVGIGITPTTEKFELLGNLKINNRIMPGGVLGSNKQVLSRSGSGMTWQNRSAWLTITGKISLNQALACGDANFLPAACSNFGYNDYPLTPSESCLSQNSYYFFIRACHKSL